MIVYYCLFQVCHNEDWSLFIIFLASHYRPPPVFFFVNFRPGLRFRSGIKLEEDLLPGGRVSLFPQRERPQERILFR